MNLHSTREKYGISEANLQVIHLVIITINNDILMFQLQYVILSKL